MPTRTPTRHGAMEPPEEEAEDPAGPTRRVSTRCHAVPEAQPGRSVIVLGQSPFATQRHPTVYLAPAHAATAPKPLSPHHPLAQSKLNHTTKQGVSRPKDRCSPRPPLPNTGSGLRIDGGSSKQPSSHQLPREEPWLPSPPASCSSHLFCFYFRRRWGSGSAAPSLPSAEPRRQISAKRQRRLRSPSWQRHPRGAGDIFE